MTQTTSDARTPQIRDVVTYKSLLTAEGRAALPWQEWSQPGRAGAAIHTIYTTDDELPAHAFLVRFAPGAHGDLHEHIGYEMMFVLEGELNNDNGDVYTVGDLIIEKPESIHQVYSDAGCTLLVVREAPTVPR
jgi:anti-sigma factor ChrR (cupin superfamily)